MRLTRLELSGFKSFADAVQLAFEDGITAVVGPNGCGKSNISDAVRWVLGEQRARLLRSARMDEVIFQGSVKRRPINLAGVSLVFDNSDGELPIAYHEVSVTRRLSRNGQSEYQLNQSPVRLRDVQDLLRGTGLGSDAGVVIEAQMIDRLLSDRTEERRSLFEEAAGIGLYRDRKASTERRLERTAADLQRLEDLIGEVQSQVRSLARQRGRAERHQRYLEQRFAIVITLTRRALAEFDRQHADLERRRETLQVQIPAARDTIAEHEGQRERRAQERAAAEARRTELERQLGETRVALERLEGDLNVSAERLEHAAERRTRAQEERADAEGRAAQAQRELEAAATEREAAQAARQSVQTELDLRSASEDEARERLNQQRTRSSAAKPPLPMPGWWRRAATTSPPARVSTPRGRPSPNASARSARRQLPWSAHDTAWRRPGRTRRPCASSAASWTRRSHSWPPGGKPWRSWSGDARGSRRQSRSCSTSGPASATARCSVRSVISSPSQPNRHGSPSGCWRTGSTQCWCGTKPPWKRCASGTPRPSPVPCCCCRWSPDRRRRRRSTPWSPSSTWRTRRSAGWRRSSPAAGPSTRPAA
jgi:energy-coupling factor transporter ATP-binding protein EcfA2